MKIINKSRKIIGINGEPLLPGADLELPEGMETHPVISYYLEKGIVVDSQNVSAEENTGISDLDRARIEEEAIAKYKAEQEKAAKAKVREKVTADGKKFQKMLEDLNKLEVRIGIQQGVGSEDGVDLVDIAMFNELGTVHIPSRPFLRDSVDAHSPEINAFLQSMRTQLVKGGSAEDVLKKIGVFQKGLIQKEIVNGDFVPNSPETIKRKGSDKPLIDTGRMRQSINYVIQEKGGSD